MEFLFLKILVFYSYSMFIPVTNILTSRNCIKHLKLLKSKYFTHYFRITLLPLAEREVHTNSLQNRQLKAYVGHVLRRNWSGSSSYNYNTFKWSIKRLAYSKTGFATHRLC